MWNVDFYRDPFINSLFFTKIIMSKNIILKYLSFFSFRCVSLPDTMKGTTVSELLTCRWIQEINKNNLNHETAWKLFFCVWTVILWLIPNWPNFVEGNKMEQSRSEIGLFSIWLFFGKNKIKSKKSWKSWTIRNSMTNWNGSLTSI